MARTPIQTAVARYGGFIEVPVDCGPPHGVIDWRFVPGVGATMLAAVDRFQGTDSPLERFRILADYLVSVVHAEQRDTFSALVESDVLDMETLGAIFQAVREDASGMDPTQPPSSDGGSSTDGQTSTVGQLPEV